LIGTLKIWNGSEFVQLGVTRSHGDLAGVEGDDHLLYAREDGVRGFSATVSGQTPVADDDLATKDYIDTISGSLQVQIGGPGVTAHDTLTGLLDDDHPQYVLADGSRGFSATVSGVDPVDSDDLATKNYVDDAAKTMSLQRLVDDEDVTFFYEDKGRTISKLIPKIQGLTASGTTWTLRHGTDRDAVGTEVITGGTNTHSGTGGNSGTEISSFNSPTIAAGNYVWFETTTASGIIDEFSLTLI